MSKQDGDSDGWRKVSDALPSGDRPIEVRGGGGDTIHRVTNLRGVLRGLGTGLWGRPTHLDVEVLPSGRGAFSEWRYVPWGTVLVEHPDWSWEGTEGCGVVHPKWGKGVVIRGRNPFVFYDQRPGQQNIFNFDNVSLDLASSTTCKILAGRRQSLNPNEAASPPAWATEARREILAETLWRLMHRRMQRRKEKEEVEYWEKEAKRRWGDALAAGALNEKADALVAVTSLPGGKASAPMPATSALPGGRDQCSSLRRPLPPIPFGLPTGGGLEAGRTCWYDQGDRLRGPELPVLALQWRPGTEAAPCLHYPDARGRAGGCTQVLRGTGQSPVGKVGGVRHLCHTLQACG